MAAGLSLPLEHVELFRRQLNENTALTEQDLQGKIVIDVPMPLDYISKPLIEELNLLEPFGKSNEIKDTVIPLFLPDIACFSAVFPNF